MDGSEFHTRPLICSGTLPGLMAGLLLLASCQSRVTISDGMLDGHAEDPSVRAVSYVTTRSEATGHGDGRYFGADRGQVQWGVCNVHLKDPELLKSGAKVTGISTTRRETVLAPLDNRIPNQGPVILYVHGYNIGFEKGCRRAAILAQNLRLGERLLLFSWLNCAERR